MFLRIVLASLRQPALVLALAVALLVLGLWRIAHLPVDVLPELARPTVSVQTEAPSLAPDEVEAQISVPLEAAIAGLPGLVRLRSTSAPGLSLLHLEFDWGLDLYRQRQLVAERLEMARPQLPPDVRPRLGAVASLMGEVLLLSVQAEPGVATPQQLREWADWRLRPALLALPGVAQVIAIGGDVKQYEIRPDPQRLRLNGVTLQQVETALRGSGVNSGAGFADRDGADLLLRSIATPLRLDELRQTAVAWRNGGSIVLGQVADVAEGVRIKRGDAGADGAAAVILSVQKQPGTDTRELTAAAEARAAQLIAAQPPGWQVHSVFRQADFIAAAIGNVGEALLHAAIVATLVLWLFLASGRATLAAAVALPLSLVAAVAVLALFGLPVNTLTLGGLAIAVGEVVDDAVVGVENVMRRARLAEPGPEPASLVANATAEVRSGIFQATLVIAAVVLPLLWLPGVEGRLFAPLAGAYLLAILASLVVAVTVTPVLCRYALLRGRVAPPERGWMLALKRRYLRGLDAALNHPRLLAATAAFAVLLSLPAALSLPREFLPAFNESTLTVNLLLEPGVALADSQRVALTAEQLLRGVPEVAGTAHRTGRAEQDEHAEGTHYSELEVRLKPSDRARSEVVEDVRRRLAVLPGQVSVGQPISHRLDHVLSGVRAPLAVKLVGDDLDMLRTLATQLGERLRHDARVTGVQVEKQSLVPQWRLQIDARRAAQYGLSPPRVQEQWSRLIAGEPLSLIAEGERRFELVLRLPEDQRQPDTLSSLLFDSPAGAVPLSWLARIERTQGPNQIVREALRRRIVVSAYPAASGEAGALAVDEALRALPLPPGFEAQREGEASERAAALQTLALFAALALLLMAAIVHARYGDWRATAIVMLGVPLAGVGGIAALWFTQTPLSIASLVGFIALAGIAARNAILKLSHALSLGAEHGALTRPLLLRACEERLTPVLMTTLIAALSLLPLLWAGEAAGKELLHPLALTMFGGLLSALVFDALITPLLIERWLRTPAHGDAVSTVS